MMNNEEVVVILKEIIAKIQDIITALIPCKNCAWNDLCEFQPYTLECKDKADLTRRENSV